MLLYKLQKKRENTSYQAYRVALMYRTKLWRTVGFSLKKKEEPPCAISFAADMATCRSNPANGTSSKKGCATTIRLLRCLFFVRVMPYVASRQVCVLTWSGGQVLTS